MILTFILMYLAVMLVAVPFGILFEIDDSWSVWSGTNRKSNLEDWTGEL